MSIVQKDLTKEFGLTPKTIQEINMYAKTTTTMIIALVAMIGLTGIGSAMDTDVQYNGDGSYTCDYDAHGTGSLGIHTYTSDGSDHLLSGWTNTDANGWQQMDTHNGVHANTGYSGTVITRSATVGGANNSESEAGYIVTITTDNGDDLVYTYADYRDDVGCGSHITTGQTVVVGSLVNINGSAYNVTGVVAITDINGYAYGANTTVSGLVRTQSGDEYTYAYIQMDNGRMRLFTLSAAGSVTPDFMGADGACGQTVTVMANGEGTFGAGAGTDMHGAHFYMKDDLGVMTYNSNGMNVTMDMVTTFDGGFTVRGYVYAVDLNTPTPT